MFWEGRLTSELRTDSANAINERWPLDRGQFGKRITTTGAAPVGSDSQTYLQVPHRICYCFCNVSAPEFVTVPNSPLEVMSVVPVNEGPFTVPWNVISIDPPRGNWL